MRRTLEFILPGLVMALSTLAASSLDGQNVDQQLRQLMADHGVSPLDTGGGHSAARIALGQALFFDRELSGNRDTSCATCHHPTLATGDALALPVGTAPENPGALGMARIKGYDREFVPRNAPEIFNRGSSLWTSMFWDSRVARNADGSFTSPPGDKMLPGLSSVVYMQAMLPVTSRDEMRGRDGDLTFDGEINEIAQFPDSDLHGIWSALMNRLLSIPEYQDLFEAAYPGKPLAEMTFADAANAIGAFEINAYTFLDSPFDRYVAGDSGALTKKQKRGAMLFFGRAGCANCHSGSLLTDQQHYGLAVPQLGPGKAEFAPHDVGRFPESDDVRDFFAFRTPPLRNVAATGPYMHNGAFNNLRDVIRHHSFPLYSLLTYQPESQLAQTDLRSTVRNDWMTILSLVSSLDSGKLPGYLNNRQVDELETFLNSLTAPDLAARIEATIPDHVPSGLPVER